jgi:hypothetical protein
MLVAVAGAWLAAPCRADEAPIRRAVEAHLAELDPAEIRAPPDPRYLVAIDEAPSPWTFTASLYLWATSVKGDVAAGGASVSIDVPFSELFDDLTGAFMGRFEARKGKWGILADVFWASLEDSTAGPLGGTIRTELDLFIAELTGSYTILERGEEPKGVFVLDLYAGARAYSVDVEITTTLASPEQSETWVDPIVGFDARYRTGKWLFLLRADIGGFDISSELSWSVMAGVAYRCSRVLWLSAGYRLLDIDFESGGAEFTDVRLSGPFFALAFQW